MYLKLRRTNIPFASFPSILSSCSLQSRASSNPNPRKSTEFAMCSSFSPVRRVGTFERFILGSCNGCLLANSFYARVLVFFQTSYHFLFLLDISGILFIVYVLALSLIDKLNKSIEFVFYASAYISPHCDLIVISARAESSIQSPSAS